MTIAAGVVVRETLKTGLGMFALWNRPDFAGIVNYETWKSAIGDDGAIERQVAKGTLIPIKVHSYGAYTFEIRVGSPESPAELTPAERRSVTEPSEPYLFHSQGGLNLSAIEAIGSEVGNDVARVRMVPGEYSVRIYRMEENAFVILVRPASER